MADVEVISELRYARGFKGRFAWDRAALDALNTILDEGAAVAQAVAPDGPARDDYGRRPKLKDNIDRRILDARTGEVYIDAVNALSQETGAVAHEIHGDPELRFFWIKEGKWFKGPKVNHPGNAAQPFMEAGFRAMDEIAESAIAAAYGGIL